MRNIVLESNANPEMAQHLPAFFTQTRLERRKGLLGRDEFGGLLIIDRCRSVHSFGMKFDLDIAFLRYMPAETNQIGNDNCIEILRIDTLLVNRGPKTSWAAQGVLEAQAGTFRRLGIGVGDKFVMRNLERRE